MKYTAISFAVFALILAALFFLEKKETARLQFVNTVYCEAHYYDREKIQDLSSEITILNGRRTYEEGFADALIKSSANKDYTDAYTRGYHQAISQNNEEIVRLNSLLSQKQVAGESR